jgi:methyl-accepting chemotaxis protein
VSLSSYIIRTLMVVIPGVVLIALAVCLGNGISGSAFGWTIAGTALFGIVLGILSATLNYRRFVAPIAIINDYLEKMTEGDLSVRVPVESVKELRPIALCMNEMAKTWGEVMAHMKRHSDEMTLFAEQLSHNTEQTTKATEQIATTMENIVSHSDQQAKMTKETSYSMNEISSSLLQVAANTEQVTTNAGEMLMKAAAGKQSIEKMEEQMRFIHEHVQLLGQIIKGLGERSTEIGQITQVITGISSQTNLLALNAAIEAARAGEQGKGFAVVADEVRKLAEQSAQSAQQITKLIDDIQQETDKAIGSMDVVADEVSQGLHVVQTAGLSFEQIRQSINGVNEQIEGVSVVIRQMTQSAQNVASAIEHMAEIVEQSSAGSSHISAATQEQMASMEEIASSASALNEMAGEMQNLLGKFRV